MIERCFYNVFLPFYSPWEIKEGNIKMEEVNVILGLDEMALLDGIERINYLIITGGMPEEEGLCSLYSHSEIKGLMLDYWETDCRGKWSIDLQYFKNLKILISDSSLNFYNFHCLKDVKVLFVKKWYDQGLSCIKNVPIESLIIGNGLLLDEEYYNPNLKEMSVSYSSITSITRLNNLSHLELLELDHCSVIEDWHSAALPSLKVLLLLGNNRLDSVSFVLNLPNLQSFVYEGIILNPDISVLTGLQRCALLPHSKKYSVKKNELKYNKSYKTELGIDPAYDYYVNRLL